MRCSRPTPAVRIGSSNALFLPDGTPNAAEPGRNAAPEALEPALGCRPKSVGHLLASTRTEGDAVSARCSLQRPEHADFICRSKAAPFAAEGDQLVVAAVATAQAQEAVGQDAAFEEGVELVLHELRQVCAGSVFRPERRTSRRAAAQSGTAWSVPGGGVRSGQGCHPAPAGAANRWLAREAPEMVSPHGLKPCATPQSPSVPPTDVCPQARAHNGDLYGGPTGAFGAARSEPRMSVQGAKQPHITSSDGQSLICAASRCGESRRLHSKIRPLPRARAKPFIRSWTNIARVSVRRKRDHVKVCRP